MDRQRQLDDLDGKIRRLKVDFDRFFNGAAAVPPEELRQEIQGDLRRLRSRHLRTYVERFRLGSLEARYNALSELFNRRLRETEVKGIRSPQQVPSARRDLDPYEGVVLQTTKNERGIEAIYNVLYHSSGRSDKVDFGSFQDYLQQRIAQLREKTGCSKVRFRVAQEGNELKLKAKPIEQAPSK